MIFVIDRNNSPAYRAQLEGMFEFGMTFMSAGAAGRRWKRPDGRDIDQLNTQDTTYLLGLDDLGNVCSGLRLNPTTRPHLIDTVFPHAVTARDIPVGDDIYEFTRYFVVPDRVDRMAPASSRPVAGRNVRVRLGYRVDAHQLALRLIFF